MMAHAERLDIQRDTMLMLGKNSTNWQVSMTGSTHDSCSLTVDRLMIGIMHAQELD
jgi:hypothetical protein